MKMNPFAALLAVDWSAPRLRLLDFALAAALVAAGLVLQSDLTLWIGLAGLAFAIVNPMGRVQRFLQGFRRPDPGKS
jgi:hypothetical protein